MWQSCQGALVQSALAERIEGVRVADIMDTHPVAIPAATPVTQAVDEFFLRYQQAVAAGRSTTPAICWASPARSAPRRRSTAARRG